MFKLYIIDKNYFPNLKKKNIYKNFEKYKNIKIIKNKINKLNNNYCFK